MNVKFKITEFLDPRKQGCELELDKPFMGILSNDKKKVFYTDNINIDWVFYVGDTCVIVEEFPLENNQENPIVLLLKNQEQYLLKFRERYEKLNRNWKIDTDFIKEKSKFIGMLKIAEVCSIDCNEFQWIYNV